jgi:hypothetical protein
MHINVDYGRANLLRYPNDSLRIGIQKLVVGNGGNLRNGVFLRFKASI